MYTRQFQKWLLKMGFQKPENSCPECGETYLSTDGHIYKHDTYYCFTSCSSEEHEEWSQKCPFENDALGG